MSAPSLASGERDVDEAAVVADQHRDAVALPDPELGQRVGQRVAAVVDLAEGQLAQLVDQRRPVRGADRDAPEAAGDADPPL